MITVGQVIVSIGSHLYEVGKGKECGKCAFYKCGTEPCWSMCHDFYPQEGSHFKRLDAVRSYNVLAWLKAESETERAIGGAE